jgi:nucleoside-diphosphate-sugar epimerase
VYGWGRCSNVVQSIIEAGQASTPFEVWGKGVRRNQYTLIDDIVDGLVLAMDEWPDQVVNLISPEVTTVGELAELLERNYGFETRFDTERNDPPSMCYMASYRALDAGWEPTPLEQGVKIVVQRAISRGMEVRSDAPAK